MDNLNDDIILCGGRNYGELGFDRLVDQFGTIVRHNWLTNDSKYGKRYATFQVLNIHMHHFWAKQKFDLKRIVSSYAKLGQTRETVLAFREYIVNCDKVLYFQKNNASLVKSVAPDLGWDFKFEPRCGIGSMLHFVKKGMRPSLIGYSLNEEQFRTHSTNVMDYSLRINNKNHSLYDEIRLIKHLHKKDLIDATFCAINVIDNKYVVDADILEPTSKSIELLREIYGKEKIDIC